MPRIARKRRNERKLTITLTFTGNLLDAYDAARQVLDAGTLQYAMAAHTTVTGKPYAFRITNTEVK